MSQIFLCHASEDKPIAESVEVALSNAGHRVFYDDSSLPPGGDYHDRISKAIKACDLFIFLISKASIAQGKYTLTELKFAREKWRSPIGRVLPVNLQEIPTTEIPKYLTGTTMLSVKGNLASEVRASAQEILEEQRGKRLKRDVLVAVIVALFVGSSLPWWWEDFSYWVRVSIDPCINKDEFERPLDCKLE